MNGKNGLQGGFCGFYIGPTYSDVERTDFSLHVRAIQKPQKPQTLYFKSLSETPLALCWRFVGAA